MLFGDYSLPEFELLKNIDWVMTEKVDGTNTRLRYDSLFTEKDEKAAYLP